MRRKLMMLHFTMLMAAAYVLGPKKAEGTMVLNKIVGLDMETENFLPTSDSFKLEKNIDSKEKYRKYGLQPGDGPLEILAKFGLDASYMEELRRLNPHAFPTSPIDIVRGGPSGNVPGKDGLEDILFLYQPGGFQTLLYIPNMRKPRIVLDDNLTPS